MYESEVNSTIASSSELPEDVLARFAESRKTVTHRTLIPWSEHCTECVWPTCYTTCDLYRPRVDGRCRRFVEGMVRIDHADSLNSYILKIAFRRWAKLWSFATLSTYPLSSADTKERRDEVVATCVRSIPVRSVRKFVSLKRYAQKQYMAVGNSRGALRPDHLLIECYSPNAIDVPMTVSIRRDDSLIQFQAATVMKSGFNRHRIPVSEIERLVDLSGHFHIELTPNDTPEGLTLYFGALDFVVNSAAVEEIATQGERQSALCKCIVWDLDNTLWEGTLVEDGPDRVRLKPRIPEILRALDERGILLSIASKNNNEDASTVLRRFGVEEYFLYPQITWSPKSEAVRRVAANLNIGLDSLRFIDDSPFERGEVESNCPGVVVVDAAEYLHILDRADCQSPLTADSRSRRLLYRDQQRRMEAQQEFHGEYITFLKKCALKLRVRAMCEENIQRAHELTQRTNQMNFSGNRYSRDQLMDILCRKDIDTYVLDCSDCFGSYGTVGFCLVNRSEMVMNDLMFSCRVQGKRIEHAFVSYLIRRYRQRSSIDFQADYRRTSKNAVSGKVFDDLGFQVNCDCNGTTRLVVPASANVSDEGIVEIDDQTLPVLSADF